jgi:hypothetical protein
MAHRKEGEATQDAPKRVTEKVVHRFLVNHPQANESR